MLFYSFPKYQSSYTRKVIANDKTNVCYVSSSLVTSYLTRFLAKPTKSAIKRTIEQNTYMQKLAKFRIAD